MQRSTPHVWPTVVHMLQHAASTSPEAIALVCGDETLNYREYAACVTGLAEELMRSGAGPGRRVALVMANSVDIAIATFAVQASGAQVVPLNPAYTSSELVPILESAEVCAIIHDVQAAPVLQPLLPAFDPDKRISVGAGGRRLLAWRNMPELADRLPLPTPDMPSTLQYTGGTTGRSKGVDLTHRAVATNVSQREALVQTEAGNERILVITPLFHSYAVCMGLYLAAYSQGTLVILPRYKPDLVLRAIEQHAITVLLGSPTLYAGLLGYEGTAKAELRSLRISASGSSALPADVLKRWESISGSIVCEGYGQSEAVGVLSFNPSQGVRKVGSVGIAAPETELQVVDLETGENVLPAGHAGEIRARGPQLLRGYRKLEAETAEALRGGWLYTGDIGELDDDGYLYIRGRKKDMVIVGGFNVYPREVEEAAFTHPFVEDVAAIGIPDAYRGEVLVAWVVRSNDGLTEQDLIGYLAERLVKYKVPAAVQFVAALPKTSVGKPDKNRLREGIAHPRIQGS